MRDRSHYTVNAENSDENVTKNFMKEMSLGKKTVALIFCFS